MFELFLMFILTCAQPVIPECEVDPDFQQPSVDEALLLNHLQVRPMTVLAGPIFPFWFLFFIYSFVYRVGSKSRSKLPHGVPFRRVPCPTATP